jgi:DNA-binding MarR family transcriptional regulator
VYYPRMTEVSGGSRLDAAASGVIAAFHGAPRRAALPPTSPAGDLTLGQVRLLFLLHRGGSQPMGRIAEIFGLSSTASTGLVERVERHGLVERHHRSDDRRVVECSLTDAGRRFVEELSGIRLDVIRGALSVLEPAELSEFHRLLTLIEVRREGTA